MIDDKLVEWNSTDMVEVKFNESDDFLKIKETLTRIGVPSNKSSTLYQSCHILHKRGKYYIVHFKELFALDNKKYSLSEKDVARRNTIIHLLQEWGLLEIISDAEKTEVRLPIHYLKVIHFKDKDKWDLVTKYSLGKN